MIDLKKAAAELDHTVVRNPGGMGGDDRWSCKDCGMAILRAGVVVSGSAATTWCPGVSEPADDSRGIRRG